jgi:glycosyltransferase involved in cell wall biosynthesis
MKGPERKVMIGIFIHTYSWGRQIRGDERGYIEKVKQYKRFGVDFFTLERDPSIQASMGEEIYTSLRLGNCTIPPQTAGQLAILSIFSIVAAIRRFPSKPIAVYAYNQDIENLWVAYLLKVLLGTRLVVVHHQIRPAAFVAFRQGFRDRIQRGFHPLRAISKSLLPAINRFAASHAEVHIALSEATRRDVERYLGIKRCVVIGNGLDTEKFRPIDIPKTFDAVFLGRLARQKGIDVLLKAWSKVVQENPDSRLILLGGGEPEEVALYKGMATDLLLDGNVTFAGFVQDEEMVRLLNSSKLFVFPSRQEGFAQAVSQAMGCGLCCILSDIPPLREVYGDAAVFCPVDQPTAFAEKISALLSAEEDRKVFAIRARRLAVRFSWETTVKEELAQISGSRLEQTSSSS